MKQITLRPQDPVILLKVISSYNKNWNTITLSRELFMSQSEISESLNRSLSAGLIDYGKKEVFRNALFEFLIHGIGYVFPVRPGPVARGIPTAHSAPPLSNMILSDEIYVWPDAEGNIRGQSITPLYSTVPRAVREDTALYELLALTDAMRVGKSREKNITEKELRKRILLKVNYDK